MRNWDGLDIRRGLPEYVVREGDVVYPAPYRATGADLTAYLLTADPTALQALIDTQLNACCRDERPSLLGSQRALQFSCVDSWVVFIYAALRSSTSVSVQGAGQGFLAVYELSIWVPIVKKQTIAGAVQEESAWFLPVVYTAPTSSVLTGREVYGYPKVPAFLRLDDDGLPVSVQARYSLFGVAQATDGPADLYRAPPHGDGGTANTRLADEPLLAAAISRYLANHPVVFRKQVALTDAGETAPRARYTALVESRIPVTRVSEFSWSRCSTPFTNVPAAVTQQLGLATSQPPFRVSILGCTLDVQQGREIWVSKEPLPLIPSLPAFDDEAEPVRASFAMRSADSELAADDDYSSSLNGPLRGTGEVYFASARPKAIAALLERDFPRGIATGSLTADAARDFVMLMFLRADDAAAVRLYEFGVWVPIRHDGRQAWYVPYMFRSPGAAVVHARQWLGHPCQEGFIVYEPSDEPRRVEFRQPVGRAAPDVQWRRLVGIELKASESASQTCVARARSWIPEDTLRVVGLRQVRHATDTTRACVQELMTSELDFRPQIQEPVSRRIRLFNDVRLGGLLDLDGDRAIAPGWKLDPLTLNASVVS